MDSFFEDSFFPQDSNSLRVSDSFPCSRQSVKEKECGDNTSITINVPSQKEISKGHIQIKPILKSHAPHPLSPLFLDSHNSQTLTFSFEGVPKNKEFFASVLRKLRDGKQKDDFISPGNTDPDEGEQRMSYEEIAVYVDTKARQLFQE